MSEAAETSASVQPEHYLLDDILGRDELIWLYHHLLATPGWTLTRASTDQGPAMLPMMSFPGLEIETRGKVRDEFLSGYFRSLVFRLRRQAQREHGIELPGWVQRIHVGAKSSTSRTVVHVDSKMPTAWTIIGFLNPVWRTADGGGLFLGDHEIEYKSGRFVIFRSNTRHDGGYVTNEDLNYWRVVANIILNSEMPDGAE